MSATTTDAAKLTECPYPFEYSSSWSEFGQCGIACECADVLNGYTPEMIRALTASKWLMFCLGTICATVLILNHWLDYKENVSKSFASRSFMKQSTVMISAAYICTMLTLICSDVVGVNNVLCHSNGQYRDIVSLANPHSGCVPCTIFGFLLYTEVLLLSWYTASFSACLWATFSDPFDKRAARVEALFADRGMIWLHTHVVANRLAWHCALWLLALVFGAVVLQQNAIDAFHPMGACFITHRGKAADMFWLRIFPLLISLLVIVACLLHCIYLLNVRNAENTGSSDAQKAVWAHLKMRLRLFTVGTVFAWIAVFALILEINTHTTQIKNGSEKRLQCLSESSKDKDSCYGLGYRVPPALIHWMFYSIALAVFSAMILSMHSRALKRWALWFPFLVQIGCCELIAGKSLALGLELSKVRKESSVTKGAVVDSPKTAKSLTPKVISTTPAIVAGSKVDSSEPTATTLVTTMSLEIESPQTTIN